MAKKLQLFVCENFYPEYLAAMQMEQLEHDIDLRAFPSLCEHKGQKAEVKAVLEDFQEKKDIVLCSRFCEALDFLPDGDSYRRVTGTYCFSHLVCNGFLDYLISQGSYIISGGWLKGWKQHIAAMGFNQATARQFFSEASKQLVYLDTKGNRDSEHHMKELSAYVGLPYVIIPVALDGLRLLLKSIVFEWRLHTVKQESFEALNELRSQCAEYSAVLDMLSKISTYTSRRDVIGKIKELFVVVFGVQHFSFSSDKPESVSEEIERFLSNSEEVFLLLKAQNRFLIRIFWDGTVYGVIDAKDFLFPQYIEKYLNLAIEISKFSGLVFHNNDQYEKILKSEREMKYLSFHDSMTDLYNRAYINELLPHRVDNQHVVVFMFDIDKLKYVNDHYGHAEGDRLINSFSSIMKKTFRESDIVARIGGDEFVAILYDSDKQTAEDIKQRVTDLIKANNENLDEKHLLLSASFGYAMPENSSDTIEILMHRADEQMYASKAKKYSKA